MEQELMDAAEVLGALDPVRTYPKRGAEGVARLVGGTAFRLERDDAESIVSDIAPGVGETPALSLALRSGRDMVGTLHLYLPDRDALSEEDIKRVRWGARQFSRGLGFAERLSSQGGRRDGESIEAALRRAPLTPRERDVVALLVGGHSTRSIAKTTGLTVSTVNTYLKRIFSKVGVHSRVELVARIAGTDGLAATD